MIKIYSIPGSSATVSTCALEEAGVDYTVVQVDNRNRDNPTEFKQVNPLGQVAAIDHDGTHVFETGAILLYISDTFKQANLGPEVGHSDRGKFLSLLFYLANTAHPAFMPLYSTHFVSKNDIDAEGINAHANEKLLGIFDFLESQLKGVEYLVGNKFSVVDLYSHMLVSPNWTMHLDREVKKRPNLYAHWQRINERPAVQKALAQHATDKAAQQTGELKIG